MTGRLLEWDAATAVRSLQIRASFFCRLPKVRRESRAIRYTIAAIPTTAWQWGLKKGGLSAKTGRLLGAEQGLGRALRFVLGWSSVSPRLAAGERSITGLRLGGSLLL